MAKSEFGDDYEKTTVLGVKDIEIFTPGKSGARSAYLIVINGKSVGKMFKLSSDTVVVGRAPTNEILIDDEGVSRRHAFIERAAAGLVLVDGEKQPGGPIKPSTNGVFVNGIRVDRHLLQDGDKVQLGSSTILKFSFQDEVEERAQKQIYEMATRDGLTNAYNKKYFADQLKTDFAFYHRHGDRPLSLVLFDIDFFKKLNDGYGHQAGDYVLKTLAGIVQKALRTEDIFARYGGEEFGIILRDTDGERSYIICERIRKGIESFQFLYEGKRLPVAISIGIATLGNQNYANPKALVKAADEFLYSAKHNGRNRTESALMGAEPSLG